MARCTTSAIYLKTTARNVADKWTHPILLGFPHLDIRGFGGHEFFGFGHHGSNLKPKGEKVRLESSPFLVGRGEKCCFYMGVSLNGGTQQPWVFLLKMITLGCFGDHHWMRHPYGSKEKTSFLGGCEGGEGGCFCWLDIGIACRRYLQSNLLGRTQIQVPMPEVKLGTLFKAKNK